MGSLRGHSSHNHNPFLILKRPPADGSQGEAVGFSLVYSGNFLAQAEVDTYDTTRGQMVIKIVNEELVKLMGSETTEIKLQPREKGGRTLAMPAL